MERPVHTTPIQYTERMRFKKGAHAVYKTEYHVVWTPRYRKKLFPKNLKREAEEYLKHIPSLDPDIEVIAVAVQPDHIHMVIDIPPRVAVADVIQFVKSQSASTFKRKYGFMQRAIWGREGIWSRGYFVSTVGVYEKTILAYVAHQDKEDRGQLQLELGRS